MTHGLRTTREWLDVDAATFRNEIVPRNEPAVLRGLIKHWPAVQAGLRSAAALCDYLRGFDRGGEVETLVGDPAIKGHFFYSEDLRSLNFTRRTVPLGAVIERLRVQLDDPAPPAIAVQAAPVPTHLP